MCQNCQTVKSVYYSNQTMFLYKQLNPGLSMDIKCITHTLEEVFFSYTFLFFINFFLFLPLFPQSGETYRIKHHYVKKAIKGCKFLEVASTEVHNIRTLSYCVVEEVVRHMEMCYQDISISNTVLHILPYNTALNILHVFYTTSNWIKEKRAKASGASERQEDISLACMPESRQGAL